MKLMEYVIRRILQSVIILIVVIFILYIIFRLTLVAIGDPASRLIDPKIPPTERDRIRAELGIDRPWDPQVIGKYFISMVTGQFLKERSFFSKQLIETEINSRIGPTLLLFGTATIIAYLFGIVLGILIAWYRNTLFEMGSVVVSLFFYSMPLFWFGLILLWLFSYVNSPLYKNRWVNLDKALFPIGGMTTTTETLTGFAYALDILWHMILPVITLVLLSLAGVALLMRSSLLETLGEDYITTARGKGLKEGKIMFAHAGRNAMLPIATSITISIGGIISGGVLTETIFSWPGMGRYLVSSTFAQDFPVVQAVFFILAILTIVFNIVADVLYAFLDPRIRY